MGKCYAIFTSANSKVLFSINTFRDAKKGISGTIEKVLKSNSEVIDSTNLWKEPMFTIFYNDSDLEKDKSTFGFNNVYSRINIMKDIKIYPSLVFVYSGVEPNTFKSPDIKILKSSTTKKEALLLYECM